MARSSSRKTMSSKEDQREKELREVQARVKATLGSKAAFEYGDLNMSISLLLTFRGTFWPMLLSQVEFYVYPIVHTILVIVNYFYGDGGNMWGSEFYMVPFAALGLVTSLMVFFLVFFLSQCYSRFMDMLKTCMKIESAVHEATIMSLTSLTSVDARWDTVRYLTASAIVIYSRLTKTAVKGIEPQMLRSDWERLVLSERDWQATGKHVIERGTWEKLMGWPRGMDEAKEFNAKMQNPEERMVEQQGLAELADESELVMTELAEPHSRNCKCPGLLHVEEVDELRKYPGAMMSLVLQTWCLMTLKEANDTDLKGPLFTSAQAVVLKMRESAYKLRGELAVPIPLPYLHALTILQNITFALFSYSFLSFNSCLTPVIMVTVVVVTVGMREVAVSLSNPFGTDECAFPIDKWISNLRAMALLVHPVNAHQSGLFSKPSVPPARLLANQYPELA